MKLFNKKKVNKNTKNFSKNMKPLDVKDSVRLHDVIIKPIITEKISRLSENNVYGFEIKKTANKSDVSKAVQLVYGVTPLKIRTAKTAPKPKRISARGRRGDTGYKKGIKKAYVYLKKGDSIELN